MQLIYYFSPRKVVPSAPKSNNKRRLSDTVLDNSCEKMRQRRHSIASTTAENGQSINSDDKQKDNLNSQLQVSNFSCFQVINFQTSNVSLCCSVERCLPDIQLIILS